MLRFKRVGIFVSLLVLSIFIVKGVLAADPAPAGAAPAVTILKLATLAPEGTSLFKGLTTLNDRIKAETGGKVALQIYAGGTAGDEKDVVRKMRIGQLHGAALTGVGLGMIEPEVRVLELPFLFKNQGAIDSTYAAMKSYFEQKFDSKGFKMLGWAEVGLIQIFTGNKPVKTKSDLAGMKMWMWEGDPLAQEMYKAMSIVPVPLAVTDVLTSLQTGLIDGCYAPPLAAIAFQWHTKVKYMTKVDLTNGTGGLVLAKAAWDALAPAQQAIVKNVIASETVKLTSQSRADNLQSLQVLQGAGIQVVELTPEAKKELEGISAQVQQNLIGKLYPKELLDKVVGLAGQ